MNLDSLDFSIIVPTYNRGVLLKKTLLTLLNQNHNSFEVLVIDDGSTDDTEEMINELNHLNLIYHKIANGERGAARNYGAQKARGAYVNFFDSDDLAYTLHLDHAKATIDENNSPEVFALSYHIVDENENIIKEVTLNMKVSKFICQGNHLSCNGVFIKRETALAHPFNEDRALSGSEDYELWLRLAARYPFPCFSYVSHAVVQHDARSTSNFKPEPLIERKSLMIKYAYEDSEVQTKFGTQKDRMKSSAYSYIALHLALGGGDKKQAISWWKQSIKLAPGTIFSRRTLAILKHILLN